MQYTELWCKGSATDFDSVNQGSIPCSSATKYIKRNDDILDSKFISLLSIDEVVKSLNKINNYKTYCSEQVSQIDRELTDLDHALELVTLDCTKQSKMIKFRKAELQKRRFYKNELEYINAFEKTNLNIQTTINNLKSLKSAFQATKNRLDNRVYTPRCLYEVFGIAEDKQKELEQRKKDKLLLGNKATNINLNMESKFRVIDSN